NRAGKWDEAIELAQKSLELREKLVGPDGELVAEPLFLLGNVYHLGKAEYAKAEPFYLRALKIQENTNGAASTAAYSTLMDLGALYNEADELEKAEPVLERAVAVGEKVYGLDGAPIAGAIINLASALESKGDYNKAEQLYLRALAIGEKRVGPNDIGLS